MHSSLQRPDSELSLAQQVPGDALLKLVAERAHNKDWKLLGNKLNVATEEIEQIEMNNLDDPVAKVTISLSFFRKWQNTHVIKYITLQIVNTIFTLHSWRYLHVYSELPLVKFQVFQMLKTWRDMKGDDATAAVLEKALRDSNMNDIALLLYP